MEAETSLDSRLKEDGRLPRIHANILALSFLEIGEGGIPSKEMENFLRDQGVQRSLGVDSLERKDIMDCLNQLEAENYIERNLKRYKVTSKGINYLKEKEGVVRELSRWI